MVEIIDERVGTLNRKYVLSLDDGARVEAVLYRGDSLCISTQVGCAVGCPFCASGANGLGRNLELEELIGQVQAVRARGGEVSRVTLSGVGEPLHNFDTTARFIERSHAEGTPVSLTTSGGPTRRLPALFALPHRGVSFSVHAGTESTRARVVPRGPSLDSLFETLGPLLEQASVRRRRRVALAYLLVADLNDDDAEVDAFVERVAPLGVLTHLYAYNPVPTSTYRRVGDARYQQVFARMRKAGLEVRRSSTARIESTGGCGTLVALRTDGRVGSAAP